ncbi:MAG: cyclase family protein [Syntrophobacterales bacterium]|nr:MAG: cyclase family protein [Syntrophobacterales bacterium]
MKKKIGIIAFSLVMMLVFALSTSVMAAEKGKVYWPEKWWPSKWGADDNKGSFNTITPAKVKAASKLVKTGKVYLLGRPYSADIPLPWGRSFNITIPGIPIGGPFGDNAVVWNDEIIFGELGQVGTQFDGPGHVGMRGKDGVDRWYNGRALGLDPKHARGLKENGIENLGPCVTRGVLIDVAGLKGVKSMAKGEVITVADVEACIKKAGIAGIKEGDAVIFNTGWGHHWKDAATFNAGEPGIGIEVARYLIDKNISMVGADSWAVDAIPGEYENLAFEIHCLMQIVNGIWYIECLNTETMEQMVKDGVYEFMWVYNPVRFMGATGSPGDPLAIR